MPDQGQIGLVELGEQLNRLGFAYVKAVLVRSQDGLVLRYLSAVIGIEPPGWQQQTWEYEEMDLVSDLLEASRLSILTEDGPNRTVTIAGLQAAVPAANNPAQWNQRPSFFRQGRAPLPRSSCDIALNPVALTQIGMPNGLQVGRGGAPSLPSVDAVCDAFLNGRYSLNAPDQLPSSLAILRIVGKDAWIGRVHIEASRMTVDVDGRRSVGANLELSAPGGSHVEEVGPNQTVSIPLPDGLPPQAWLWLKSGTEWLDYRAFSAPDIPQWRAQAGITIDVPVEPVAAVEALIFGGEGPRFEVKSQMPRDAKSKGSTFKTVAAFANGLGGTIIIGVERDEMTLVGVEGDPIQLRDQLSAMVRSAVVPTPPFHVDHQVVRDTPLLVLHVEPGQSPPYGLLVDKGSKDRPDFFVRRGANTYPAQPADLREAVLARSPPNTAFPRNVWEQL